MISSLVVIPRSVEILVDGTEEPVQVDGETLRSDSGETLLQFGFVAAPGARIALRAPTAEAL